jgi:hypothetical protein
MGVFKGGINHGVNMIATPRAFVSKMFLDPVKSGVLFASRTVKLLAKTGFHKVIQAGVVVGELLEKLLNFNDVFHGFVPPCFKYNTDYYIFQVYNYVDFY